MPVACLVVQRFAVEAERRRRRNINARLVLVGENIVYDCSLGASVSKVEPGMRMSEAIGLCPNAVVFPTDTPYYQRLFGQILDHLETLSPEVEPADPGTTYLSLNGLEKPPSMLAGAMISDIHSKFGFLASVGVARGKFAARLAARTIRPGSIKVMGPDDESSFLAPLPIEYLPASEAMRWRLAMLGVTTIGEVARLPLGAIQAQFGIEGNRCWELARGIDDDALKPRIPEATVTRRMQLPAAATTLDTILTGTEKLTRSAYSALGSSRWVRKVIVRMLVEGGGSREIPVAFREALSDPADAWFVIKNAIQKAPPEQPVEEIEVELTGLSGEAGKQSTMLEGNGRLWRQIEEAVRQIDSKDAASTTASVGKIVPLEPRSRIPERRAALADLIDGH